MDIKYELINFLVLLKKNFGIWANIFGRVIETELYVFRGSFWGTNFCESANHGEKCLHIERMISLSYNLTTENKNAVMFAVTDNLLFLLIAMFGVIFSLMCCRFR